MPRGRPKSALVVAALERATLEDWAQGPSTSQALAQRALIVLACAEGGTNASVAVALAVTPQTVGKWRERFVKERLPGLADAARSGAPCTIPAGEREWVLALTLFAQPRSSPRWSARSLGAVCGMSESSVARIWQGFGLRPGSIQPAPRRSDAKTLASVESLVALYLDANRRAGVRGHRVESHHGLRDWLAECDAATCEDARADLILYGCGQASETYARNWQGTRPRFGLHIVPRGPLWLEIVGGWFATGAGAKAPAWMARVGEHAREAVADGGGFEGGTASYAWSPAGEWALRTGAGVL